MAVTADVPANIVFWSGLIAGMTGATSTHFLDVGKVTKQVARNPPGVIVGRNWTCGLSLGAFAQGQRFATTLLLDSTLQENMKRIQRAYGRTTPTIMDRFLSFGTSMFASGIGEFLANPPVAIKNYQIAHNTTPCEAVRKMYLEKQVQSFFRGVTAGVVRKSVTNAIVLQTMSPARETIATVLNLDCRCNEKNAALTTFIAGGVVGGLAEVAGNPMDRVKTMMQADPRMSILQAFKKSAAAPFEGAGYAFVRKGSIHAIKWGVVGVLLSLYQSTALRTTDGLWFLSMRQRCY